MKKLHKLIYVAVAVFVIVAVVAWFFAFRERTVEEQANNEINGFALDDSTPHSIDLSQIAADGTTRDGVPAISQPKFVPIIDASTTDETPGILVQYDGEKHFYPYNIIAWHQVVNDYLGATPIVVTYPPECGSPIAYKRQAYDQSIWFGLSGLSYDNVPLLYDDATESLWLQNTGEAIVGERNGSRMESIQTEVITWEQAKQKHPTALALSNETGFSRNYQADDYPGKNDINSVEDDCAADVVQ
jgi:hypothetical protein